MNLVTFVSIPAKKRYLIITQPSYVFETVKGQKKKRAIQYVPTLDTIYIDEQLKIDPKAVAENLTIGKSALVLDADVEPQKVELLSKHHQLGKYFKILNIEADEALEILAFEASDKAKSIIMTVKDVVIRAMAIEFISPSIGQTKSIKRLRLDLRELATKNKSIVERVIAFADDNYNNEKLVVSALLSEKEIKLTGKTFSWYDSDEKIFTASQASDAPKSLAIWLKNDKEGRQTMSIFINKIEKINK